MNNNQLIFDLYAFSVFIALPSIAGVVFAVATGAGFSLSALM